MLQPSTLQGERPRHKTMRPDVDGPLGSGACTTSPAQSKPPQHLVNNQTDVAGENNTIPLKFNTKTVVLKTLITIQMKPQKKRPTLPDSEYLESKQEFPRLQKMVR
jgi:hypothetical protein